MTPDRKINDETQDDRGGVEATKINPARPPILDLELIDERGSRVLPSSRRPHITNRQGPDDGERLG